MCKSLREIITCVKSVDIYKEIILIDDFSTDGSHDILPGFVDESPRVYCHDRNRGKGAALRTGFTHVTGDYRKNSQAERKNM